MTSWRQTGAGSDRRGAPRPGDPSQAVQGDADVPPTPSLPHDGGREAHRWRGWGGREFGAVAPGGARAANGRVGGWVGGSGMVGWKPTLQLAAHRNIRAGMLPYCKKFQQVRIECPEDRIANVQWTFAWSDCPEAQAGGQGGAPLAPSFGKSGRGCLGGRGNAPAGGRQARPDLSRDKSGKKRGALHCGMARRSAPYDSLK